VREKLSFVVLFGLLTASAFAGNPQPAAVYTFACKGGELEIGPCPDGGRPSTLNQGSDGNFYGVATFLSEGSSAPNGGTIFSVTPAGTITLLHEFLPGPNSTFPEGNYPGGLVQGSDGKLYGFTFYGGVGGCNGACGDGVLYRLNTDGSDFQIIHEFCSDGGCGSVYEAASSIVAGTDGNLYGTVYAGGSHGDGFIFRVTPSDGSYRVVANFNFSADEGIPSGLTAAADGSLYAIALSTRPSFLVHYTPSTGSMTTVVLNFPVFRGGDSELPSSPVSGLTFGPNGNLYGLYRIYGENGQGLFEVEPNGSKLRLLPFYTTVPGGGNSDGLILASDGNFWMAEITGSNGFGDILTISPYDGSLIQMLTPFSDSAAVGANPLVLIQANDGTLWGTTAADGDTPKGYFGAGVVFSVNAGLPPE
jgi:uncharacterized repeat protein (TIGR03803 family)